MWVKVGDAAQTVPIRSQDPRQGSDGYQGTGETRNRGQKNQEQSCSSLGTAKALPKPRVGMILADLQDQRNVRDHNTEGACQALVLGLPGPGTLRLQGLTWRIDSAINLSRDGLRVDKDKAIISH